MRHPPDWQADAACREHTAVTFFPERGEPSRPAKAICAGCLVKAECLSYAFETEDLWAEHGIWGGMTVSERRRLRTSAA